MVAGIVVCSVIPQGGAGAARGQYVRVCRLARHTNDSRALCECRSFSLRGKSGPPSILSAVQPRRTISPLLLRHPPCQDSRCVGDDTMRIERGWRVPLPWWGAVCRAAARAGATCAPERRHGVDSRAVAFFSARRGMPNAYRSLNPGRDRACRAVFRAARPSRG